MDYVDKFQKLTIQLHSLYICIIKYMPFLIISIITNHPFSLQSKQGRPSLTKLSVEGKTAYIL